jgi:hypothetical protein
MGKGARRGRRLGFGGDKGKKTPHKRNEKETLQLDGIPRDFRGARLVIVIVNYSVYFARADSTERVDVITSYSGCVYGIMRGFFSHGRKTLTRGFNTAYDTRP